MKKQNQQHKGITAFVLFFICRFLKGYYELTLRKQKEKKTP